MIKYKTFQLIESYTTKTITQHILKKILAFTCIAAGNALHRMAFQSHPHRFFLIDHLPCSFCWCPPHSTLLGLSQEEQLPRSRVRGLQPGPFLPPRGSELGSPRTKSQSANLCRPHGLHTFIVDACTHQFHIPLSKLFKMQFSMRIFLKPF